MREGNNLLHETTEVCQKNQRTWHLPRQEMPGPCLPWALVPHLARPRGSCEVHGAAPLGRCLLGPQPTMDIRAVPSWSQPEPNTQPRGLPPSALLGFQLHGF